LEGGGEGVGVRVSEVSCIRMLIEGTSEGKHRCDIKGRSRGRMHEHVARVSLMVW